MGIAHFKVRRKDHKAPPRRRGGTKLTEKHGTYSRIADSSADVKAVARAFHLKGKDLEAYLQEEDALLRGEKSCSPDSLFPDLGYEHASPTTFELWREGQMSDARLEKLYGSHIRECDRCSNLYAQYRAPVR